MTVVTVMTQRHHQYPSQTKGDPKMTNHKLLAEFMVDAAKKGVAPTEMERMLRQRFPFVAEDEMRAAFFEAVEQLQRDSEARSPCIRKRHSAECSKSPPAAATRAPRHGSKNFARSQNFTRAHRGDRDGRTAWPLTPARHHSANPCAQRAPADARRSILLDLEKSISRMVLADLAKPPT
jgi:hypothetical protein